MPDASTATWIWKLPVSQSPNGSHPTSQNQSPRNSTQWPHATVRLRESDASQESKYVSKSREGKTTQKRDSSHAELKAFFIVGNCIHLQSDFYLLYIDLIHIVFFWFFRWNINILGRSSAVWTDCEVFVGRCQCLSCSGHFCLVGWDAGSLSIPWMDEHNVFRMLQHNYAYDFVLLPPPNPLQKVWSK